MSDIKPDSMRPGSLPHGGGISSRFNEWLRRFGRQSESQLSPKIRPTHIATFLAERLKNIEGITPPEYGEKQGFMLAAVSATIGTNEKVVDGFLEAVQAKLSDGYIVGVGAGNIFSLLHCFPEGELPKGIVSTDIDPRVVAVGKLFTNALKESETSEDLIRTFFTLSDDQFQERMKGVIDTEENSVLRQRLQEVSQKEWEDISRSIREKDAQQAVKFGTRWQEDPFRDGIGLFSNVDVVTAMLEKFSQLKTLAMEGNIAIVYADFTNPTFIAAIQKLPEFQSSKNIIYFSNIADHITRRGRNFENIFAMETLRAYEEDSVPPIFIDTLGSLAYRLRARNSLPRYRAEEFEMLTVPWGSQKEIEAIEARLIFADEKEKE